MSKESSRPVGFTAQLRITYETAGQFENQFGGNISTEGMFIPTKNPKPLGTKIKIQIMLRDGRTLLDAEGVVLWNKQLDRSGKAEISGMGVKFTSLSDKYRQIIEKIISRNPVSQSLKEKLASVSIEAKSESSQETSPVPGPRKAQREIVLGIDLGTTYTCCAYVEDGKPKIIPSDKGYYVIPSVVGYYEKKRQIIVGHAAVDQILTSPENTIYGFKRLIGRNFHSPLVAKCKEYFTYPLFEGPNSEILVELGGERYTLTDISAMILKEIHEVAEGTLKREISKAVISVPAYYNDHQRQAVRKAGEKAGLKVLKIVNEPTAAALAYGYNRGLQQTILIYDLGGGTFDVSVLRITGNVFETLATGGDNFLGGLDFDKAIMEKLVSDFEKETGIDVSTSPVCMQRIRNAAEKMKIELSSQLEASVHLPFIAEREGKPIDLRATMTRDTFNELTSHLVNRTLVIVEKVLNDIKLEQSKIDEILLVGGQTRTPLIPERITKFFGKHPKKGVHPDEVVALGMALYGYSLSQLESVLLKDIVSIAIGIGLPNGKFKPVIPKNSPVPMEKKFIVSTVRDNQTEIHIDIFQGDGNSVDENEYLGSFHFDKLPPAPRGEQKLVLTFSLNEECILTLTAVHEESGRTLTKRIITKDTPESLREALARHRAS